jgi:urea transport system ATP-binding protein
MLTATEEKTQVTQALLYLDGVSVSFDGFKAINGLSLYLAPGEMRAIIGPNGAGKTTMMDIITGKTRPDEGEVLFDGGRYDLTKLDEAAIAELGIGRKFQKPTVFESHTVSDNIILALKGPRGPADSLFGQRNRIGPGTVDAILDIVRLSAHRNRLAGDLSHGQKQWLEIGMLLAQDPKLLLVDEPVAGMTDAETGTRPVC